MSGIRRIIAIGMTVLSGIAIYCFYSLKYPYHLHFQEQYQLPSLHGLMNLHRIQ